MRQIDIFTTVIWALLIGIIIGLLLMIFGVIENPVNQTPVDVEATQTDEVETEVEKANTSPAEIEAVLEDTAEKEPESNNKNSEATTVKTVTITPEDIDSKQVGTLTSYVEDQKFLEAENISPEEAKEHCSYNAIRNPAFSFECFVNEVLVATHVGRGLESNVLLLSGVSGPERAFEINVAGVDRYTYEGTDGGGDTFVTSTTLDELTVEEISPYKTEQRYWGSLDAAVKLAVFIDLDDPFSWRLYQDLKEIKQGYSDDELHVQFLHFPLTQLHPNAFKLAIASECVAYYNKDNFWSFINEIYSSREMNQPYDMDQLPALVSRYGILMGDFQDCYEDEWFAPVIQEQQNVGISYGVVGTPSTFVIGGRDQIETLEVPGAQPKAKFIEIIDSLLE